MIAEALNKIVEGGSLDAAEAEGVMAAVMAGEVSPARLAALLTALRMKGESDDEILGFARAMRAAAVAVAAPPDAIDTCGTGGDFSNTFNISTGSAIVAAAAGVTVAKHGNRSATSQCGSADVLEALGVKIAVTAEQAERCLERVGIAFLFAPAFHPAMRHAGPTRAELGIRTVFNILGPLSSPAGVKRQALGVARPELGARMAAILGGLGCERALVFHGSDGLDEITLAGPTTVHDLRGGTVTSYEIGPDDLGLAGAPRDALAGGGPEENAAILRSLFAGETGPKRDALLANAAAALVVAGKADDLPEGVRLAAEVIDAAPPRTSSASSPPSPRRSRASRGHLPRRHRRTQARRSRSGQGRDPLADLKARAASLPPPLDFRGALDAPGIQVIAEVKKASPSRGDIAPHADHVETARAYAAAGAAAISVLTEEPHFKGRLSYLTDIKHGLGEVCPPLLRKDFIVDPYQVYEARAYGADALLLIVASLTGGELADFMGTAAELGLGCLVEVHDAEEAERAAGAGASVVGINNRDLRSFTTDLETTRRVRPHVGEGATVVSESGIKTAQDAARLAGWGVDAFLIGEALMTAPDPGALLKTFLIRD